MIDNIKENYLLIWTIIIWVIILVWFIYNLYSKKNTTKYQTFSINKKSQIENYTNNFQYIYSKEFDMESILEWTYYYVDNNKNSFTRIESELQDKWYNNFHILNNNENEPYFFWFKRNEIHTANSLVNRNIELEELWNNYWIQYDGFEFWNIENNIEK
mgnify:FL=1|jgi:hypothetical protein